MGRCFEQHSRLTANYFHILGFCDAGIVDIHQLHHFTFSNHIGGIGQNVQQAHVVQPDHHLKGSGVEKVADQYTRRIAPQGIGSVTAATQVRLVNHIVMQQGGGVQELDNGGQWNMIFAFVATGVGGQKNQQGAQAFAAGLDDVLANLADQCDIRMQLFTNALVDQGEIVTDNSLE